jgi:glycosyltransferase involved in cell wall biosynthesis
MPITVTAIIPTLAEASRATSLARAIQSLQASIADTTALRILVVINGQRFDSTVVEWLSSQPVDTIQIPQQSLPIARLVGRQNVRSDYFCFLDDDDEYLPHGLDVRLNHMKSSPDLALVVTNGLRCEGGSQSPALPDMRDIEMDPLRALFRANWLTSCGALYQSSKIGHSYFEDLPQFLEWTWLAFRLATDGQRLGWIDTPTFRIHDTPGSASKSDSYVDAHDSLYQRMLPLAAHRSDIVDILQRRIQNRASMRSVAKLRSGDLHGAWVAYREVLRGPQPWRYASQFFRLIAAALRRWGKVKRLF